MRTIMVAIVSAILAVAGGTKDAAVVAKPSKPAVTPTESFAQAGRQALSTLERVYYSGVGMWRSCDVAACPSANLDWGDDSLTYTLAERFQATHDQRLLPVLESLVRTAPRYPAPCTHARGCRRWSDVPEWDAIALADEYLATGDPAALTKAELAFGYVQDARVFALGACPKIPYQKPGGGQNHLKTLETEANAVKAALLLYRATGAVAYLDIAAADYEAVRTYFLDPQVPLYSVYVFDDGHTCTQLPHRFYASVNGDMIWAGAELYHDTAQRLFLDQATATASAVEHDLADGRGIFADLQAENDVVEPLVEGMDALAHHHNRPARDWLLKNAAAALSARTPEGSFGRFFDGPPPAAVVTEWQTNGGLALEIAAAELSPKTLSRVSQPWLSARAASAQISSLPARLRFQGAGIALVGTLGEHCCEHGHARVLIDGRETFDQSGIWQNKSSVKASIPGTTLFAWRWRSAGTHTLTFLPGSANGKEGGSFLHIAGYEVLAR